MTVVRKTVKMFIKKKKPLISVPESCVGCPGVEIKCPCKFPGCYECKTFYEKLNFLLKQVEE